MTIQQLINSDKNAREALTRFYRDPAFDKIRIAFSCHSPAGDANEETNTAVHHGKNLGTRYVFNTIEELVTKPEQPQSAPRRQGGPDPDLDATKRK